MKRFGAFLAENNLMTFSLKIRIVSGARGAGQNEIETAGYLGGVRLLHPFEDPPQASDGAGLVSIVKF